VLVENQSQRRSVCGVLDRRGGIMGAREAWEPRSEAGLSAGERRGADGREGWGRVEERRETLAGRGEGARRGEGREEGRGEDGECKN
jgi:hypothetical protein